MKSPSFTKHVKRPNRSIKRLGRFMFYTLQVEVECGMVTCYIQRNVSTLPVFYSKKQWSVTFSYMCVCSFSYSLGQNLLGFPDG